MVSLYLTSIGLFSFSNLIFKFELMQTQTADHDFDNIPTYIEAIEGDLNLYNKDLDGDLLADFIDTDDDGDGMLTSDEVRVETYTEDSRSLLETTLNALELESNQFLSPIKFQPNRNNYTANRVTILDSNGNGVPNYSDDTESDRIE